MTINSSTSSTSQSETLSKIAKYFDKHGDTWRLAYGDDTEHWYDYPPLRNRERFALALIDDEPKGSAVDLGCGNGHLVVKMKKLGFDRVRGVDLSDKMLAAARSLARASGMENGVELLKANVEDVATIPSESVDVCTALGVVEYLDSDAPLLKEVFRILRPGGAAVMQTRNYRCINSRAKHFIATLIPAVRPKIRYREHVRGAFLQEANRLGFTVEREFFSHFYALFPLNLLPVVRRVIRPLDNFLSKCCERFATCGFSEFLASMYIVKLRKGDSPKGI
jgi:SAM-dependent methyltransferase